MPKGIYVPPGPSLYPECFQPGTYGARLHWVRGTVTCQPCRDQQRIKVQRYRQRSAVLGRRTVPALGTQRRIQALARWGYTFTQIGAELGVTRSAIGRVLEQDVCFADTAQRIAGVYRRLVAAGKPGTSDKTRSRAIAAGWAGPLDWDDIDNPDEIPWCVIEEAYAMDHAHDRKIAKRGQRAKRTPEQLAREREGARLRKQAYVNRQRQTVAA